MVANSFRSLRSSTPGLHPQACCFGAFALPGKSASHYFSSTSPNCASPLAAYSQASDTFVAA